MKEIKWTNLDKVLHDLGDEVIQTARANLDANNSNASHNLYDTMEAVIKLPGDDGYMSVSISLADYWRYVEEGTGPQHIPEAREAYWPRIQPLKEWVSVKPGVPKDPSFAYAVRGAIRFGTKDHPPGTKPHPFFKPAVDAVLPKYEPLIENAVEQDIRDYINDCVEDMLKKTWGE